MYKHLLVPTDGSLLSDYAVDQALALAKALGAKVTLFTAIEPFHVIAYVPELVAETRSSYDQHARRAADQRLTTAAAKAASLGIAHTIEVVTSEDPHAAIIATARAKGCDLITMASHGRRGIKALVLGSVTTKVLTHSEVPVLVYRHAAD